MKRGLDQSATTLASQLSGLSAGRLQEKVEELEDAWLQLEQTLPGRHQGNGRNKHLLLVQQKGETGVKTSADVHFILN